MSKLICVEYAPTTEEIENYGETPLSGLIGETLDVYLKKGPTDKVPVRFPLVGQNSRVTLVSGDRDASCPYTLQLEGEMLSKGSLYQVKRKEPVSLYKRSKTGSIGSLVGSNTYFSIYSLSKFKEYLNTISAQLPYAWIWSLGKGTTKSTAKHLFRDIFLEARVYCVRAALNIQGSRKFKGLAVQVIYKPQPTQRMRDAGTYVMRSCVDLHILANSEENINYIDGTQIQRETTDTNKIINIYRRHITPKQATKTKRFAQHQKELLEHKQKEKELKSASDGVKKSEKVVVKKGSNTENENRPPSLEDKAQRNKKVITEQMFEDNIQANNQFTGTGE